jgi:hypothetical protein
MSKTLSFFWKSLWLWADTGPVACDALAEADGAVFLAPEDRTCARLHLQTSAHISIRMK